jgi:hypothetical protein
LKKAWVFYAIPYVLALRLCYNEQHEDGRNTHVFPTETMNRSGIRMQEMAVTAVKERRFLKIRHDELLYDNCNTICTNNVFMLSLLP